MKTRRKAASCKLSCFCRINLNAYKSDSTFESLRRAGTLRDICLVGNDSTEAVFAHKVILFQLGPRFQQLLRPESDNENETTIRLEVGVDTVKKLVSFAYTGQMSDIDDRTMSIAKELDIGGVLKLGSDHLLSILDKNNALQTYNFARTYLCQELQDTFKRYVLQNFPHIPGFFSMDEKHLDDFLSDDQLNVKEEQLFNILLTQGNQVDTASLMKHVRFTLMTKEYFEEKVLPLSHLVEFKAVHKYISAAKSFFGKMSRRSFSFSSTKALHKFRIPNEIVLAVGGWSAEPNGPTCSIETFDVRASKWQRMKFNVPSPRAYHGLATLGKQQHIYIFGGYDGEEYFSATSCYDAVSKVWCEKAPMYSARCYVSSAVVDNYIYAIGGFNGRTRVKSVEMYNPQHNMWSMVEPMRLVRSDACAVTFQDKIYVIGGFTGEEILDSVEIYDPANNEWRFGPRLNSVRSGVKAVVYHNSIYVMGGFNGQHRLKTVECLHATEVGAEWRYVTEMHTRRSNFTLTVVDDKILVMGGFEGAGVIDKVEAYCGHTNTWTSCPPMNLQRSALSAVTLSGLPNARYYVNRSTETD